MVVSCRTTTRPNDGTNLWSKPSDRPARIALRLALERGGQLSGCQNIKLGSGLTYRTSRNSGFRPCQSLEVVALRDGCSARVAGTKDPSEPSRKNWASHGPPPVLNRLTSPCQDRGRLGGLSPTQQRPRQQMTVGGRNSKRTSVRQSHDSVRSRKAISQADRSPFAKVALSAEAHLGGGPRLAPGHSNSF